MVMMVVVPTGTVEGQCSTCLGATALVCEAPAYCVCNQDGVETSCSYRECCQQINTCCDDPSSDFYTCSSSLCECGTLPQGGPIGTGDPIDEDGGERLLEEFKKTMERELVFFTGYCLSFSQCCLGFDRRKLQESKDRILDAEGLQAIKESCGDVDYKVSLYVEKGTHLLHCHSSERRRRRDRELPSHCRPCSVWSQESTPLLRKRQLVWDKDLPELENEPHPMGLFKASELVDAFEQVESSGPGPYHHITNNCADLHINLAKKLGVTVDAQAVAYVSQAPFFKTLVVASSSTFVKVGPVVEVSGRTIWCRWSWKSVSPIYAAYL